MVGLQKTDGEREDRVLACKQLLFKIACVGYIFLAGEGESKWLLYEIAHLHMTQAWEYRGMTLYFTI